jgi:hypothetical protein
MTILRPSAILTALAANLVVAVPVLLFLDVTRGWWVCQIILLAVLAVAWWARCRHDSQFLLHNFYGDEINLMGGKRSEYLCADCGARCWARVLGCEDCRRLPCRCKLRTRSAAGVGAL